MTTPIALPNEGTSPLRGRWWAVAATLAAAFVVIALWGPVARGLHEQSIRRWCVMSTGHASTVSIAAEQIGQIDACVAQALADPAYAATLRAGL